jgi:hypothetical protein
VTSLFERFRPQTFGEVIGHDAEIARLIGLRDRGGFGGRAFWLTGASGTGKTTIARLIAAELASLFCTVEVDAGAVTTEWLADAEQTMHSFGAWDGKIGRAFIINEAHGLTGRMIRALNVMLEPIPSHVCWIFTTTKNGAAKLADGGEDIRPLLSRCVRLKLEHSGDYGRGGAYLAWLAREAQMDGGLDGALHGRCVALLEENCGNYRAAIQAIDSGLFGFPPVEPGEAVPASEPVVLAATPAVVPVDALPVPVVVAVPVPGAVKVDYENTVGACLGPWDGGQQASRPPSGGRLVRFAARCGA